MLVFELHVFTSPLWRTCPDKKSEAARSRDRRPTPLLQVRVMILDAPNKQAAVRRRDAVVRLHYAVPGLERPLVRPDEGIVQYLAFYDADLPKRLHFVEFLLRPRQSLSRIVCFLHALEHI